MRITRIFAIAALAATVLTASPATAASGDAAHYWTPERMRAARSLDIVVDRATGRAALASTPQTAALTDTGSSWTADNAMTKIVGKVFFTSGRSNYVCSGSIVSDSDSNRAIILSAGHCAWNQKGGKFYTNWIFVPNYDKNPAGSCTGTTAATKFPYGCWTARSLVVGNGFAAAKSLTNSALQSDWSFAVVTTGGYSSTQVDAAVGDSLTLNVDGFTATGQQAYSFGYPAASPYNGKDLTYCAGALTTDSGTSNTTWGLACTMTGGSSGGPWVSNYNSSTGKGEASGLNSYGYNGVSVMYGPKFNANTTTAYTKATTITLGTNARA